MKNLRIVLPLMVVMVLIVPTVLMAQDTGTDDNLNLLDALAIVQEAYGDDVIIVEAKYDADNFCWKFEFANATEVCVDEITGNIVVDDSPEMTPDPDMPPDPATTPEAEMTPDSDDDFDDDDSDDSDDTNAVPTVTLEEAIAIALTIYPNSEVTDADLEMSDDGRLIWDIELDDDVYGVDINAMTGAVLFFGFESRDADDDRDSDRNDDRDDDHDDDRDDDDDNDDHDDDDDRDDDGDDHDDDHDDDDDD